MFMSRFARQTSLSVTSFCHVVLQESALPYLTGIDRNNGKLPAVEIRGRTYTVVACSLRCKAAGSSLDAWGVKNPG